MLVASLEAHVGLRCGTAWVSKTAQTWQQGGLGSGSGCSLQALQPWADFLLSLGFSFLSWRSSFTGMLRAFSLNCQQVRSGWTRQMLSEYSVVFCCFFVVVVVLKTLDSYCFLGVLKYKRIKIFWTSYLLLKHLQPWKETAALNNAVKGKEVRTHNSRRKGKPKEPSLCTSRLGVSTAPPSVQRVSSCALCPLPLGIYTLNEISRKRNASVTFVISGNSSRIIDGVMRKMNRKFVFLRTCPKDDIESH